MNGNYQFEIGDWVMGKSRHGELVSGYIETVDSLNGLLKVHVLESDNVKTIGKSIGIYNKSVEKLPVSNKISQEQVLHLIDLALLTKDEQWFFDLSTKLNELRAEPKTATKKHTNYPANSNRIGKFDTKS